MTTVKELAKWLERFPEDTIVQVAKCKHYKGIEFADINLEGTDFGEGWEFFDFNNYQWIKKDHPLYGKKYLYLGDK